MSIVQLDTFPTRSNVATRTAARSTNALLASLPDEDYEWIAPHLKSVPMKVRETLYKQDARMDSVYFPGGGACALVKVTAEGQTAEIAVVGAEGVIGANVSFGFPDAPCDVVVQVAGPAAQVLPAEVFTREINRRGALYERALRYNQALMMQIMQSTACNGLHSARERCARWLLLRHDLAGASEFRFTHELVASMLGVRRPTVTLIVGNLQASGLIDYRRGMIRILDKPGLEVAACECYRAITDTVIRLLPDVRSETPS